jgi:hypothetical protein
MKKPRPTDEEFGELKRKRDEAVEATVRGICETQGWDFQKVSFHQSGAHGCYCACPDGPCQHVWSGPDVPIGLEDGEDASQARGGSVSCSLCGQDAMSHDFRCAP